MTRLLQHGRSLIRKINDSSALRQSAAMSPNLPSNNAAPSSNHDTNPQTDFYATSSIEGALNQVLESQRVTVCQPDPEYENVVRSLVKP